MIEFQKVTKNFSHNHIGVTDLSFAVEEGKTLVLLGPSGSGKTTALRLMNRLIEPTSGTILFKGENILDIDPINLRRHIGYAIQHIGLFPHMTVEENIGIVPKLLGWPDTKIKNRVEELLSMLGLDPSHFKKLFPSKLSGGQKQRIGVGRALAADPPVILMDEPFAALDPLIREQLQNEFLQIQSNIHKTIVFVTHDLSEAVKMGDQIAVFEKGALVQMARPEELIHEPASDFIDHFLGKDRFQLLLQTKSLRYFLGKEETTPNSEYPSLPIESSLIEALRKFKATKSQNLAIFDGGLYIGHLNKTQLLEKLIGNL